MGDLVRAAKNILLKGVSSLSPAHRRHRQQMRAFYSDFIRDGDLCFDVGANMGNRVDVFLELGARVVAVEPQDDCCRELRRKYGTSERVEVVPKALGETNGEARLMISSASTLSTLSNEWIDTVTKSGRFSTYR